MMKKEFIFILQKKGFEKSKFVFFKIYANLFYASLYNRKRSWQALQLHWTGFVPWTVNWLLNDPLYTYNNIPLVMKWYFFCYSFCYVTFAKTGQCANKIQDRRKLSHLDSTSLLFFNRWEGFYISQKIFFFFFGYLPKGRHIFLKHFYEPLSSIKIPSILKAKKGEKERWETSVNLCVIFFSSSAI